MTCVYCDTHVSEEGVVYDIEGDTYCSHDCRRDHILHSISRALFLIAGKGPRE